MHLGKMGTDPSGWIGDAWNWGVPVAIGYAMAGLDAPIVTNGCFVLHVGGDATSDKVPEG